MDNRKGENKSEEAIKFKGRFISAIGRRKTAVAQIRLYKNGTGVIIINGRKANQYFSSDLVVSASQPLKLSGLTRELDFSILAKGGGKSAQAVAIRHGVARALVEYNKELRPSFKVKGFLTRDARKKERKKPGLKRARRAPQWAKR